MNRKFLYLFYLLYSFMLLVGCEVTISFDEPEDENQSTGEVNAEGGQNDEDVVMENKEKLDDERLEDDENVKSNLDKEQYSIQVQGDMDPASVHRIMETYGSMYISSMKLEADVEAVQTNIYQESPLTWDIAVYINQSSKITTHEQIIMGDGRTDDVYVEVYSHPDVSFMNIAETGDWLEDENQLGGYRHYYWINSELMKHFVNHSDLFVGYDDDSHFRIKFAGTDEQFKEIIFWGFDTIADDTLNAFFISEGGDMSGELIMRFEKESNTLTDYTLSYEATTTVPGEGDYHVIETGKYRFSEFDEHNSLTIPFFVYE